MNYLFLHGFLGQGQDWQRHRKSIEAFLGKKINYWAPDLFSKKSEWGPEHSVSEWAHKIAIELKQKKMFKDLVLWGYSLGGRLGLHLLELYPEAFKEIYILSSNPLQPSGEEKIKRESFDRYWEHSFETKVWERLMEEWNSFSLFSNSVNVPERMESHYDRKKLALAFKNWSHRKHFISENTLIKNSSKIKWIVGSEDTKYLNLYIQLKKQGLVEDFQIVPNADHRLIFSPLKLM